MSNTSAVEDMLFAALEKPGTAERTAFLNSACAGDTLLRRRVEKLLKAHDKLGDFLQKPVGELMVAAAETADSTQAFDTSTDRPGSAPLLTQGAESGDEDADDLSFLTPSTRTDSLGRIGHYEVLQVLGKGGFGIVLRAFDEVLHREVAIKVLAPALAVSSTARKRFLREAQSAAQVRHENVVQVHEVGEQPLPYLVMDFIPGETLQNRLDRTGPLAIADILRIGGQLAEGLAEAHEHGLVHRDVKPANVLLESGARARHAKLTDFGLARVADDATLTQSGVVAGTPMYMSPEQAMGGKLDHRADLFSLGSVLYVMATGRPPFRADTMYAVLKRVVEDAPKPVHEVIPGVPQWLCDLIAKLQAKKPEDRFQSAREVADLLEHQAEIQRTGLHTALNLGTGTAPITQVGSRIAYSETQEQPAAPLAHPQSRSRHPHWKIWTVAAALLLLIGGGIWLTQIIIIRDKDGKEVARIKVPKDGRVEVVDDKKVDPKVDPKNTTWAATPAQQVWIESAARMPLPERLKAVMLKMQQENKVYVRMVVEPNDGPPTRCTITGGYPHALWPLLAMPSLTSLDLTASAVTDFTALTRLPLTELVAHVIVDNVKSEAALKSMATLKTVNGRPAAEYWAERAALRREIDDMVVNASAFSLADRRAWFNSIMKKLNPKWSGMPGGVLSKDKTNGLITLSLFLTSADAPVYDFSPVRALGVEAVHLTGVTYLCDLSPLAKSKIQSFRYFMPLGNLRDLSPLAGLPLRDLDLTGAISVADLSPLARMKLESFQVFHYSSVTDVKVLLDMPLTTLALPSSITDLKPFKTMKLTSLGSSATDLAPLAGMPLESLTFRGSRPADLSPLAGMKLKDYTSIDFNGYWLWFRTDYEPDEKMLRAMPLVTINQMPAAKFWAVYDADRKALEEFVTQAAKLPPADAVTAVNAALKKNKRALDDSRIEDGAVVEVKVSPHLVGKFELNPLGPLKAFSRLKKITIVDSDHLLWPNLTPLMKLPIEEIVCAPATVAGNTIILRQMPTLKTINGQPAAKVLGDKK